MGAHEPPFNAFSAPTGGDLTEIGSLITSADRGDAGAAETLFTALYTELHRLARRELARNGHATLGTTTLLHEAYLDISGRAGTVFPDRARFMGYASRVMRGLIISYVRNRQAQKRGGRFQLTTIGEGVADAAPNGHGLQRLSDALDELAETEPGLAQVVDLKFFCGFSLREIATMRGVSERTVQRDWEKARIFLHDSIADDGSDGPD
jgi:RNA polymerase sigma factor (TIGR02999 family)